MTWEEFYTIVLEAEAAEESSELAAYLKVLHGDTTIEEEGVLGGGLAWCYLDDLDPVDADEPDIFHKHPDKENNQ